MAGEFARAVVASGQQRPGAFNTAAAGGVAFGRNGQKALRFAYSIGDPELCTSEKFNEMVVFGKVG